MLIVVVIVIGNSSSAARGLRGEVLRGVVDPGHPVRREGADQTGALPDTRGTAWLRSGAAQNAAERQLHHGATVRNVLDDGQTRGAVRVPVAPCVTPPTNQARDGCWEHPRTRASVFGRENEAVICSGCMDSYIRVCVESMRKTSHCLKSASWAKEKILCHKKKIYIYISEGAVMENNSRKIVPAAFHVWCLQTLLSLWLKMSHPCTCWQS